MPCRIVPPSGGVQRPGGDLHEALARIRAAHARPRLGLAAIAAAAGLVAGCGGDDDEDSAPAVATTANGQVAAVDRGSYKSYYAIPYAAPPVGNLRWQAPAAAANWSGVLNNTQSPAPCLQTSASPFVVPGGQEDCLYLDVHARKARVRFP